MANPTPYIMFPGTAREALSFYQEVFGGQLQLHEFSQFGRSDGPAHAIAHGELSGGAVDLAGADVAGDERPISCEGLMFSLLGVASSEVLTSWFDQLCVGGQVLDALQLRSWGGTDGQLIDRFGLRWLIGYEAN